nr:MAG TPA: hypothetical protein [Caudoviricetes sp.]
MLILKMRKISKMMAAKWQQIYLVYDNIVYYS